MSAARARRGAARCPPPRAAEARRPPSNGRRRAAGFAFEAYNEPAEQDARERGADGCDVARSCREDLRGEVYAGRLERRLCEAKELTTEQDLAQTPATGGQRDPYVIFAMNEENKDARGDQPARWCARARPARSTARARRP